MNYDDFEKEIYGDNNSQQNIKMYEDIEKIVASKVKGSILRMILGLIITGIIGFLFLNSAINGLIPYNIFAIIFPVVLIIELITVFTFSTLTFKAKPNTLRIMFLFYSALNGITLSVIMFIYELNSIIYAFGGTLVLFIVLAIYGYITKEDLSKYSSILKVGLITLILMSVINIFLRSDGLMWISSILGVIVFIIFIAVDINRIKNYAIVYAIEEDMTILDRLEIHGALNLYLDFVNLFIYILRITGRRK